MTVITTLLLTVLFVVVFGITKLGGIESNFTEYDEAGVSAQKYTLMISRDMNYCSRLTRSIMLGDDYEKNMGKLNTRIASISEHFANLKLSTKALIDSKAAASLLAAINDSEKDTMAFLQDGLQRMKALATQERNTDILQAAWEGYRKAASPLANKARGSFKTLIGLQTDILNGIQASAKTSFSSLRNVVFTVTGIILLLAIALTIGVVKSITRPLNSLQLTIENIEKESDLTQRIPVTGKDELGRVSDAINQMLEKFQGIITRLSSSSGQLASSISHVSSVTQETSTAIQQQQFEVEKVATAMNEMTATVQEVARHASEAANSAGQADKEAISGQQIVDATISSIKELSHEIEQAGDVINKLEQDSEKIGSVLDVIKSIAEQTNLLALNAAIEAARAGEQGRGFAVVADEVRTLASRTQQSTTEIQDVITHLQEGARNAVHVMSKSRERANDTVINADKAGNSLTMITNAVNTINDMNTQIAHAADEQSGVAEEINQNIVTINTAAERTSEGAMVTTSSINDLENLANDLNNIVTQFKS